VSNLRVGKGKKKLPVTWHKEVRNGSEMFILDDGRPYWQPLFRACVYTRTDRSGGTWCWAAGIITQGLGEVEPDNDETVYTPEEAKARALLILEAMLADLNPKLLKVTP